MARIIYRSVTDTEASEAALATSSRHNDRAGIRLCVYRTGQDSITACTLTKECECMQLVSSFSIGCLVR
jgi:hypothetical protein